MRYIGFMFTQLVLSRIWSTDRIQNVMSTGDCTVSTVGIRNNFSNPVIAKVTRINDHGSRSYAAPEEDSVKNIGPVPEVNASMSFEELETVFSKSPFGHVLPTKHGRHLEEGNDDIVAYAVKKTEKTREFLVILREDVDHDVVRATYAGPNTEVRCFELVGSCLIKFDEDASSEKIRDVISSALENHLEIEFVELSVDIHAYKSQRSDNDAVCSSINLMTNNSAANVIIADRLSQSQGAYRTFQMDDLVSQQRHLELANVVRAWKHLPAHFEAGTRPVVAIIDSGVDLNHPDLKSNLWVNHAEQQGKPGVDDDNNGYIDDIHGLNVSEHGAPPMDDLGHGTHCAGIVAAVAGNGIGIAGVNPYARIMPCKFLNKQGTGTTAGLTECLNYALQNKANIINASFGGSGSAAVMRAMEAAEKMNVVAVIASGNEGVNTDTEAIYPARYALTFKNIITVGSTNQHLEKSSFSNYGTTTVHVAAPGVSILSTAVNGMYGYSSGTSMSTPLVAGVAALLKQLAPSLSAKDIVRILKKSVNKTAALQPYFSSGGAINAEKAVQFLQVDSSVVPTESWYELSRPFKIMPGQTITQSFTARMDGEIPPPTNVMIEFFDIQSGVKLEEDTLSITTIRPTGPVFLKEWIPNRLTIPMSDIASSHSVTIPFYLYNAGAATVAFSAANDLLNLQVLKQPVRLIEDFSVQNTELYHVLVQCRPRAGRAYTDEVIYKVCTSGQACSVNQVRIDCIKNVIEVKNNPGQQELVVTNVCGSADTPCGKQLSKTVLAFPVNPLPQKKTPVTLRNFNTISYIPVDLYAERACNITDRGLIEDGTNKIDSRLYAHALFGKHNRVIESRLPFNFYIGNVVRTSLYVTYNGAIAFKESDAYSATKISNVANLDGGWFGKNGALLALVWGHVDGRGVHIYRSTNFIAVQFDYTVMGSQAQHSVTAIITIGGDIFVSYGRSPHLQAVTGGLIDGTSVTALPGWLGPAKHFQLGLAQYQRSSQTSVALKLAANSDVTIPYSCDKRMGLLIVDQLVPSSFTAYAPTLHGKC